MSLVADKRAEEKELMIVLIIIRKCQRYGIICDIVRYTMVVSKIQKVK